VSLSNFDVRRVAVHACVDPRTVRAVLADRPTVRSHSRELVWRAIRALKLTRKAQAKPPRPIRPPHVAAAPPTIDARQTLIPGTKPQEDPS
jgi:hypothetical protein